MGNLRKNSLLDTIFDLLVQNHLISAILKIHLSNVFSYFF